MINWSTFAEREPELAERGRSLFDFHKVAFLATVRKDGSPRLHPVTPVIAGDGLYVAINCESPKHWDMSRDGRFVLHAMLGENDEEFVITGRTVQHHSEQTRLLIIESADHVIHDTDLLFEFLIETCLWGYWINVGQPDTRPVRRFWRLES